MWSENVLASNATVPVAASSAMREFRAGPSRHGLPARDRLRPLERRGQGRRDVQVQRHAEGFMASNTR
jgi:hypothetical protein